MQYWVMHISVNIILSPRKIFARKGPLFLERVTITSIALAMTTGVDFNIGLNTQYTHAETYLHAQAKRPQPKTLPRRGNEELSAPCSIAMGLGERMLELIKRWPTEVTCARPSPSPMAGYNLGEPVYQRSSD